MATVLQAARCLALDAAAVAAVNGLHDHAIASLLLKGPAVAARLYPDRRGDRDYCDVDLLVAPDTFEAAQSALAALGYQPKIDGLREDDGCWHERSWLTPGPTPLAIDLHRSFAGVGAPDAFWAVLWSTAEPLSLAGGAVPVPDGAAAALLLALHAAAPGSAAKPAEELQWALTFLPERDWRAAADVARRTRCDAAFAAGLRLVPAGAQLADQLGLPTTGSAQQWLATHAGSEAAVSLAVVAALPTAWARIQYLVVRSFPSRGWMRHRYRLARWGSGGLLLAYAGRLVALLGRAPQAAIECRVAYRLAHHRTPMTYSLIRTLLWTFHAHRRVRRQLVRGGLKEVKLRAAPTQTARVERIVAGLLRRLHASCLERSLVLQAWHASQGRSRDVVVGVTSPSSGFHAHAWLEGETTAAHHEMVEIRRHPSPLLQ